MRWIEQDAEELAAELFEKIAVTRGNESRATLTVGGECPVGDHALHANEPLVGAPTMRFMFRPGAPVQTFPPCGPAARPVTDRTVQ